MLEQRFFLAGDEPKFSQLNNVNAPAKDLYLADSPASQQAKKQRLLSTYWGW